VARLDLPVDAHVPAERFAAEIEANDCCAGGARCLRQAGRVLQQARALRDVLDCAMQTPPSEAKSFWYSIRTTAVRFGSNGTTAS
jgi:hypothetical protein